MNLMKWPWVLVFIIGIVPAWAKPTKYGLHAKPLGQCYQQFQKPNLSEPFWKIMPYYKGQETDSSCSLASVTMVMNALRPSYHLGSEEKLLTESTLLKISKSLKWRIATRNSSTGLGLHELAKEWKKLLIKMQLENKYQIHFRELNSENSKQDFKKALDLLMQNKAWIILNYDQGVVMGEGSYGHFSPVGSFNKSTNEILIMDVDRQWYEPYWIDLKMAYKSMNTKDNLLGTHHGFLWIEKIQ